MQRAYDGQTPCEVCGAVAEPGRDLCRGCRRKCEVDEVDKESHENTDQREKVGRERM